MELSHFDPKINRIINEVFKYMLTLIASKKMDLFLKKKKKQSNDKSNVNDLVNMTKNEKKAFMCSRYRDDICWSYSLRIDIVLQKVNSSVTRLLLKTDQRKLARFMDPRKMGICVF